MKQSNIFGDKRFGFGMMRLPMKEINGKKYVDIDQVCEMVDIFMEAGFNYFDTAHGYLDELSEPAVRDCVAKRYPRESFWLTNKLSSPYFKTQEEILPLFNKQLEACGVEYFDLYLMHSLFKDNYSVFQETHAFESAMKLKEQGLIKHLGFSFHDSPEMLDRILNDHPETEVVQLQLNYLDADDNKIQGLKAYEVCQKHGKPVIVMEPIKGGRLINLPIKAAKLIDATGKSRASFALRYVASYDNVPMILSGMSNLEQMQDNINIMKDVQPLTNEEQELLINVGNILREEKAIDCTKCEYCLSECPQNIAIPTVFSYMNERLYDASAKMPELQPENGMPSDCIECGACEKVCPQHLPIPELLKKFEK